MKEIVILAWYWYWVQTITEGEDDLKRTARIATLRHHQAQNSNSA